MSSSFVPWIVAAVLVFWAVGAYNRLMRLRAQASAAFGPLEAEMSRQIELVRQQLPAPEPTQPAPLGDEPTSFWSGLHAAAHQFSASLAAARAKPLSAENIAALGAAHQVLAHAWERAEREDAHDLAGPRLPDNLLARRAQLELQTHAAAEHFNQAVARYNEAIGEFPAVLLAWLFGFRPAGTVHSPVAAALG